MVEEFRPFFTADLWGLLEFGVFGFSLSFRILVLYWRRPKPTFCREKNGPNLQKAIILHTFGAQVNVTFKVRDP